MGLGTLYNIFMRKKKERIIKDVKAEYMKRMKSPAYVKQVKRNVQQIATFNLLHDNNRLKGYEIKQIAHYFAEDIKNPITKPDQVIVQEKSEEVLTDSLLIA